MIHPTSAYKTLENKSYRTLFTLLGVPWRVTGGSWRFIPNWLGIGILLALIFLPSYVDFERILFGLIYGLLIGFSNGVHVLGHQIGGMLVGAPMDENLVTEYFILTACHDNPAEVPGRVHLARASAGPVMSLLVGFLALVTWGLLGGHILAFLAVLNLLLGLVLILPVPNADGEVIWRELQAIRAGYQKIGGTWEW